MHPSDRVRLSYGIYETVAHILHTSDDAAETWHAIGRDFGATLLEQYLAWNTYLTLRRLKELTQTTGAARKRKR